MDTPEIDKMDKVKDRSQAIGEFLEWLQGPKELTICRSYTQQEANDYKEEFGYDGSYRVGDCIPARIGIELLLAEYFDIDLKKVEEEKLAILNEIRAKTVRG